MTQILLILGITWLAVISPGADFAMVSRNSFLYGRRAGIMASIGIAISCWFHISYAVFGLAIAQRLFPNLMDILKVIGAGYLIYVGLTTALTGPNRDEHGNGMPLVQTGARSLTAGILTNGLNPKTAVFVISLYTQIIGPGSSLSFQLACGLFISLSHLIWFIGVASILSYPSIRERVLANERLFNSIIGTVLVVLGGMLLMYDASLVLQS